MDDYRKFCMKCGWNDPDYGCCCPPREELWQCDMYMFYHPEEVAEFEKSFKEWAEKKKTAVRNMQVINSALKSDFRS